MIFSISIGIDSPIVSKKGRVMRTTRCRWKLHINPLVGDCMLDELTTCYPTQGEERKKRYKVLQLPS